MSWEDEDVSSREGRTVIFVSHNLGAVSEMTHRAIMLEAGQVTIDALTADTISKYIAQQKGSAVYENSLNKKNSLPHVSRAEVITSEPNGIHRFRRAAGGQVSYNTRTAYG